MKNLDDGPKPSGITPEQLDRVVEILRENEQLKLQNRELKEEVKIATDDTMRFHDELQESNRLIDEVRAITRRWQNTETSDASAIAEVCSVVNTSQKRVASSPNICDSCGWNNDADHGGWSRVMHTTGAVTKCGACLPTSR